MQEEGMNEGSEGSMNMEMLFTDFQQTFDTLERNLFCTNDDKVHRSYSTVLP